jgi:hypothetical protein
VESKKAFKIDFQDIDQMRDHDKNVYLESIKHSFNTAPSSFVKFFYFGGSSHLYHGAGSFPIAGAKSTLVDNPVRQNWGWDEFHSNAIFFEDYFKLNAKYYRVISINELPAVLGPGDLANFGNYTLFFRKLDIDKAKRCLEIRRRVHNAHDGEELINYASRGAKDESEDLLDQVTSGEECLYEAECFYILESDNLENLYDKSSDLIQSLSSYQAKGFIEDVSLSSLFDSIFMEGDPLLKRSHLVPSSYLVNMLPLKNDKLFKTGISFHSRQGAELKINIFDELSNNFNVLVSGLSGSGKSALCQKIIKEMITHPSSAKAVILDRGGSFLKLVKYFEGDIFEGSFNPLQFKDPRYLKEFIISLLPKDALNFKEETLLYKGIKNEMESGFSGDFGELIDRLGHFIEDLPLYLEETLPYFGSSNLSFKNLTYIDTEKFSEKLLPGLILFLIEFFKHIEGKKFFVFDECWHLLDRNISYLSESYRTFRKIGASALSITQSFDDFSATALGEVIINSSDYKFLFRQESLGSGYLEKFDLGNMRTLKTIKGSFSEFYFKHPHFNKVVRYYQDPLEYELFTTHHDDQREFNNFSGDFKNYLNFKDLFEKYVRLKYD